MVCGCHYERPEVGTTRHEERGSWATLNDNLAFAVIPSKEGIHVDVVVAFASLLA